MAVFVWLYQVTIFSNFTILLQIIELRIMEYKNILPKNNKNMDQNVNISLFVVQINKFFRFIIHFDQFIFDFIFRRWLINTLRIDDYNATMNIKNEITFPTSYWIIVLQKTPIYENSNYSFMIFFFVVKFQQFLYF